MNTTPAMDDDRSQPPRSQRRGRRGSDLNSRCADCEAPFTFSDPAAHARFGRKDLSPPARCPRCLAERQQADRAHP